MTVNPEHCVSRTAKPLSPVCACTGWPNRPAKRAASGAQFSSMTPYNPKEIPPLNDSDKIRFFDKVRRTDNCWEWRGQRMAQGYGVFGIGRKYFKAHRISWTIHNGPIPARLWVLHRCDNPQCSNPAHLFLGTHADNMRDMAAKKRGFSGGNGGFVRGERHGSAKLKATQIPEIRNLYGARSFNLRELSEKYHVSITQIRDIIRRTKWKHIA